MKKRILSMTLVIVMLATLLPTAVFAADTHTNHCVCGASHAAIGIHTSEENPEWIPLSEGADFVKNLDSGYYYLTDDIQLSATWAFSKTRNIVLCLNGHDITFTGTSGSFLSGSNVTFTLTDCQSDAGKITGFNATNGGVYVGKDFTMYGGIITGNTAKYGAGVYVDQVAGTNAIFRMYGGEITGNTASTMAGGVYVKGTFEVAGAPVVSDNDNSNTAISYPSSMYKYTKNIYLSAGSIAIGEGGLSRGALLDVTPRFPVSSSATPDAVFTLATGSTSDYSAYFTYNSSHEYTKHYDADKQEVQLKYVVPAPPSVTVTFDMQGHGTQVPAQTIEKGTCATEPADPTEDGYRFLGWEDDYGLYDFNWEFWFDTTLYAKWAPASLTGTVTIGGKAQVGQTLTAAVSGSNNTGTLNYQWYRAEEAIGGATESSYLLTADDVGKVIKCVVKSSVQTGSIESAITDAVADLAVYTVIFHANDGTDTTTAQSFTEGVAQALADNSFVREGYTFLGWAESAEGEIVYTNKQTLSMSAAKDLYAVWSANPVISGTITGINDTDVTLTLRGLDGKVYPAVVTPSGDDFIYAVSVPAGTYQLVVAATVSTDSVTVTYAEDISQSKTHDIVIPTEKKNSSIVEIIDNAPNAIVDGLDAIAANDDETGVTIQLTVTAEAADSNDAEQTAIRTEARVKTLEFVDLTLSKKGSDGTPTDIGGENSQLLTIIIPFEKGNKKNISVYRCHNQAELLVENPADGSEGFVVGTDRITIHAKKFSTYAIGYTVPSPSRSGGYDSTTSNFFVDVPADAYYYDAVLWAVENGITNGTSPTTFSPDNPCTRAQMVTFLWRAAGSAEPTATTCPFTDVDMDSYYAKAVLWAVENGITNGTSPTTFSPDAECSRAQMATFLCRMANGKAESRICTFVDVKADAYYAEAVQWAVENCITNGTGENTFSPDATCTRAQMVTFLYRF